MRRASISDLWVQLIILNLIIFLFANIAKNMGSGFFPEFIQMPIYLTDFVPRFWTILTYQFTHDRLGHVFNNMIVLWIFGHLAQQFFGRTSLLSLYVIGGFFAGLLVFMSVPFIDYHPDATLIGASGAVFAVMVAVAVYAPNHMVRLFIFGNIKIKWIAIILVVLGTIIDFSYNTGGKIAHLGGILFGLLFGKQMQKFNNILRPVNDLIDKTGLTKKSKNLKRSLKNVAPNKNYPKAIQKPLPKQYKVDVLLDKISKKGLDSLTKEEKEYLNRQSQD